MVDTYSAAGDKKLPDFGDYSASGGYSTKGTLSGSGSGSIKTGPDGSIVQDMMSIENFVEIIRNIGHRLLDEPTDVSIEYEGGNNPKVSINWKDPNDLTDYKPIPCEWAGTVVVRKVDEPPLHIWDGTIVATSTTRDQYSETALEDTGIEINRLYYYGIFPYYVGLDDAEHPINHYRFTKSIAVDTSEIIEMPVIDSIVPGAPEDWDGSEIDILWSGNTNKLTVQVSSGHLLFKFYTGSTVIYSVTSPVGTSASSSQTAKVHIAFLKDDENEIAKPSFVYHTGSGTYSYNQESPTDEEMADIYIWLSPGLTS